MKPLKIIYILSHSRSGSTILDVLLGQHPEICSAGELRNLYRYGFLEKQFCSCGEKVVSCVFWKELSSIFFGKLGSNNIEQLQNNLFHFERRRSLPFTYFFRRQSSWHMYKTQLLTLYQTLAELTEKRVIVDSSKNALRCYWLTKLAKEGKIKLFPVFLLRDGRGVIWSHKKTIKKAPEKGVQMEFTSKTALKTTLTWLSTNLEAELISQVSSNCPVLELRYEDMCSDFEHTLTKFFGALRIDPDPVLRIVTEALTFSPFHLVSGNRLRMKKTLRFQPDLEWKQKLSKNDIKLFWALAGWYAKRKKYFPM